MEKIRIFQNTEALYETAANLIVQLASEAIAERGRFTISLSGGKTPGRLYELLASEPYRDQIRWKNTFVFWGDERYVPFQDERNNAERAKKILLNKVRLPSENVHRIPVNYDLDVAAEEYMNLLKEFFEGEEIRFDLILLGMGANGHTASIFPGTDAVTSQKADVETVYVEEEHAFRITMTAPLINLARNVLFMVTGAEKASALKHVLDKESSASQYPAKLIHPKNGELFWFIDEEAAKKPDCK